LLSCVQNVPAISEHKLMTSLKFHEVSERFLKFHEFEVSRSQFHEAFFGGLKVLRNVGSEGFAWKEGGSEGFAWKWKERVNKCAAKRQTVGLPCVPNEF